ncbi:jumonji superfamily protein [Rickenella mellea]|uniref:JmjC domain-containing histone demethylation protein 1 n=1 Tax=Rickenella mellea TaxID=50990 RepID=A0A4Y7QIK1_9AGAM|nr:jumonji superfamily protein [Rickenella mellea]
MGRRRPTRAVRSSSCASREASATASSSHDSLEVEDRISTSEGFQGRSDTDCCPACNNQNEDVQAAKKEDWVRCDSCKTWFHWRCVGEGGKLEYVDKWYCIPCLSANPSRVITLKPPARKSLRKRVEQDYASLDAGIHRDPNKWQQMLKQKVIKVDSFRRMDGFGLSLDWLSNDDTAMTEPVIIEDPDGLGMKMPNKGLTVSDVANLVGPETAVEVMDVATQSNISGYNLAKWAEYYNSSTTSRDKVLNVISLEISNTRLAEKIIPPRIVRDLDWVELFWPSNKKGKGHLYPKVQLYCLMGVAGAWTDWHIDFAGSSVYYHIFRGSKVFYFIRPTSSNLAAYERWSGTDLQNQAWLGDMVDEVFKVELQEGHTMIIPTGWIHAVHTPTDSLVFGGNFLHSYDVAMQLRIRDIEISTHVPKKFRFPFFVKLCWYVGEKCLRSLKAKEEFPSRVLDSLDALSVFLVSEVRSIERGAEHAKKDAKDQIPADRVKDGSALARELRWRVRLAIDGTTGDEDESRRRIKFLANGRSSKRKRSSADPLVDSNQELKFRNFKPKTWDHESKRVESKFASSNAEKPSSENDEWAGAWMDDGFLQSDEGGDQATVDRTHEYVVRVRRLEDGIERQRVERVTEVWRWS